MALWRIDESACSVWLVARITESTSPILHNAPFCSRNVHVCLLFCYKKWCIVGYLFEDLHDDVIKWRHFPRYWPFVRGIHRGPVNSPHKGQWRGALMFTLICARINGWENNREAGDLRRYRTHYDVIVMVRWVYWTPEINFREIGIKVRNLPFEKCMNAFENIVCKMLIILASLYMTRPSDTYMRR